MKALKVKEYINCKGTLLSLKKPVIMGILNATPDSFFKESRINTEPLIRKAVETMLEDGATIIDVGGQSTRPGATPVSVEEELLRVLPVIRLISKHFPNALISIDTFYAKVASQSIEIGASIVNDISAGEGDKEMIETVANAGVPYIAMHKQGSPQNMQLNPHYKNVLQDIMDYFVLKISSLQKAGISDIIIDPGFGFGKSLHDNYSILQHLSCFQIFEVPVMVGISRKSMLQKLLSVNTQNALNGTTALHMMALQNGAKILRVHDVKQANECIKIGEALKLF